MTLPNLIATLSNSSEHRSAIFVDHGKPRILYTYFNLPYDLSASDSAVAQLFDTTYTTLAESGKNHHLPEELPILQYVGRYQVTLISRNAHKQVSVTDATLTGVDNYTAA